MPIKPKTIEVGRGGIVAGPIVTSDAIYAGLKEDVTLRLDRRTLRKVWEVESQRFGLAAAIGDEFLTVGGRPPSEAGVRSALDGRLLWSADSRFSGVARWRGHAIIDSDAGMQIRHVRTGEVLKTHQIPGGYDSWKLTHGDLAVLQNNRIVKAFDLEKGVLVWERPLIEEMQAYLPEPTEFASARTSVSSIPGRLISFHEGFTFGLSITDGSILWHTKGWQPYGYPTALGGHVYALCLDRFRAIDEQAGAIVYDVQHPELKGAYRDKTGTFYKGCIAIANESGHLAVFKLSDASLASLYTAKVPLWRTAEADGRLLVATGDGTLLVFDESIWGL